MEKIISYLFYILFFITPLILFSRTSEVFEFNKMVFVYTLTTIITAVWLLRCLVAKKIIFRRTILDIPLLIFLGSQILSTIFSIDIHTSIFGYYSRFHGGLLSTISYCLLYWAYVSNMDRKKTLISLYCLLFTATIVSIYGILEHFGIDKDIWVQDVQNRVFSTLGQPNWLAAWLVALTPITWSFALESRIKNQESGIGDWKLWFWSGLSGLYFLTLLYTKSRSGLLGFITADVIFWSAIFFISKLEKLEKFQLSKTFIILNSLFLILALTIGTPWTSRLLVPERSDGGQASPINTPALETGGTESGQIRKIVWKGAVEIWKHYPIFGTGPETFAYSYFQFRPVEHNLVSEWDFLYNKAHNEYLNFLANTGTVGFVFYLLLIIATIYLYSKNFQFSIFNFQSNSSLKIKKTENLLVIDHWSLIIIALASGYASILVTNFFGFSVVVVALEFFLYPAMTVALANTQPSVVNHQPGRLMASQKFFLLIVVSCMLFTLFGIAKYWYADILYSQGKAEFDRNKFIPARDYFVKAIKLSPKEAIYWDRLAITDASIASITAQSSHQESLNQVVETTVQETNTALSLSPFNISVRKNRVNVFLQLSTVDPKYLVAAQQNLQELTKLTPSDAKSYYSLALTYLRMGETKKGVDTLNQTIALKSNYRDARYALALIYIDQKRLSEAREQLKYILEKVNPNDLMVKEELSRLEK